MRRPIFIAEQARDAKGPLGRLIAFIMARETWADNCAAIEALNVQPTDHVLDIGCGHGRALGELARRAPHGRVAGVDPSELMITIALRRNRNLIDTKLVDVANAGAECLPFEDAAFDKALCVHGVYFWRDLEPAFAEIARVLKPGGKAAIVSRTGLNKASAAFPREIYRFWSRLELEQAVTKAGLTLDAACAIDEREHPVLIVAAKRH